MEGFIPAIVLTVDQVRSQLNADQVPAALTVLHSLPAFELGWERTAGDEIQALTLHPGSAVAAVRELVCLGGWQVGVAVGLVEAPLPASTREARGRAYVDARAAVERAKRSPSHIAADGVDAADLEAALWLYCAVLERRTQEGWEVASLLDQGLSQTQIAEHLGISASAVSQRVARAAVEAAGAGERLLGRLLDRALQKLSDPEARLLA